MRLDILQLAKNTILNMRTDNYRNRQLSLKGLFKGLFFSFLFLLMSNSLWGQTYDLRLVRVSNTGTTLTVKVQMAFSSTGDLGSSNLVFTYDGAEVNTPVLGTIHNFSGGNYETMTLTSPVSNTVSLNIELSTDNAGTAVTTGTTFIDVAEISFTLPDQTGTANFIWQENTTTKTVVYLEDNDTRISKGTLAPNDMSLDGTAPTISSVTLPADDTYIEGENLDFTINTNEVITVNTTGGTPQLGVTVGSTLRQATYQSGSGSQALVFRYTVQAGEEDTNGIAVGTLSANGGTMQDAAENDLNVALPALGSTTAILVDAADPTVSTVSVPANDTYIIGENLDFTINTSENVTVNDAGGTPQLGVTIGSTLRQATFLSGSGSQALVFRYTVQAGDADADGVSVGTLAANGGTLKDAAGNDLNTALNGVGDPSAVLVDGVVPTVAITSSADPTSGAFTATFTFSEAVTGFAVGDIAVGNGAASAFNATSTSVYTATITPVADGAVTVDVNSAVAQDAAGNNNTAATQLSVTNDETAPTVTVTSSADPTSGAFTATFTFSEAVTGFAVGDIAVGNGAASAFNTTSTSVYTATITPTSDGAVTVDVNSAVAQDAAGNNNTAATQLSVTNDETAPTVTITSSADPTSGAFTATFTFSEAVTGFAVGDIAVGNGAASAFNATSTSVYTATITPVADGAVTVDVNSAVAQDAAGNNNTAATQLSVANDETAPTVTITSSADPTSGAFTATFTFSEAVTGFAVGDIAVGNGAASAFNATSTSVYTATITPAADGAVTVDVNSAAAQDAAGNNNTAATQLSVTNDEAVPTVTITSSADPTSGAFTATFTFSEAVTGFAIGDISVGNGAASAFNATSTSVYTATITPASEGAVTVDVAANVAQDGSGNNNTAATQLSVTNDETAPTVTITGSADPTSGAFTATFTFSEAVTGFAVGDIAVGNGAASAFNATSTSVYTATITPAADGAVTVDVNSAAAQDAAGNNNTAATQLSVANDETAPTVTITSSADPTSGAFTATFTFSEAVTGFAIGDISVGNGAASAFNTTSTSVYTATITPASEGAVTVDVAANVAQDASANNNTAATQLSVTNDETAPTVTITSSADPTSGAFTATFTFTEAVTGFAVGDIAIGNGAASAFNATSTSVYTATITPASDGAVTLDVAANVAQDAAGNDNTAATQLSVTNDETAPTITITSSADPTSGAFTATFTFSESVTGFAVGDIAVGNGAASAFNATSTSVYTATITPVSDGAVTVDVAANVAQDGAGNNNTAATQLSVTNDETAPTITITSSADPTSGAFTATFTFSEAVTGFTVGDISVANGAASAFSATSTSVYTATITPSFEGAVTVDVAADVAQDGAGNNNAAATQLSVTNDETAPAVTITSSADPTSGAFTATFTFTEAVTGFAVGDIAVGNGTASAFNATSTSVYTATITPASDGAVTLDVAANVAQDAAGNDNTAATQLSVTNDETAPTLTITSSADPTSGAFTATFTFSEAVTGFAVGDIAVGNGAASAFNATSTSVYTATITPASDGAVTVDVAANVAQDGAGNNNTAATQLSVTNDETAPTITISSSADPSSGAFTATFTFSEAVTGFTVGDISVANGAASAFSATSTSVYTATITPSFEGAVTVDVAADVAQDGAGNNNTAATQLSVTNDETAPAVTITSSADPTSGAFTATFTFTEAVTGFAVGDIAVGNGAASAFNATSTSVYTATITPASDGAVTLDVAANVAQDAAGNDNTAATQLSVTNDETGPTVTGVSSGTTDGTYGVGSGISIQVTFSESVNVTGTPQLELETGGVDRLADYASGDGTNTLTFNYTVQSGDVSSDLDYVGTGSLTLNGGTINDAAGNTANLTLASPAAAGSLGANKDLVIDGEPTVTLTVDNSNINEDTGTATLTATLSAVSSTDVTVTIGYSGTASNGTDYNSTASTTITVSAGDMSETAPVIITPVNDGDPETNETIIAEITGVTNGTEDGTQSVTITIIDDDTPNVSFNSTSSAQAESVASANLAVDLSIASALTVTVDYAITGTATGGGTDYTLANGTLTFNPGSTSENISIAGIMDDAIVEADETVIVTLSSPVNANLGTNQVHTYTITDNDAAAVTIADISGDEDSGDITVTAILDNAVDGGFTVDVSTANGTATIADSDYTAVSSETLSFTGSAGEMKTFVVTPTTDTKFEDDEDLTVTMGNLVAGTVPTTDIDVTDGATITITNDDPLPTVTLSVDNSTIAEASGTAAVTATLSNTSENNVVVTLAYSGTATNGTDYNSSASTTITINAGDLMASATTGIQATQDVLPEGNETILVDITGVTGGTENGTQKLSITIADDDAAVVTSVASTTADGDYKASSVIAITITFNQAVNVTGTPQLTLETGTTDQTADYVSGDGSTTLTFNYTVQAGDVSSDLDYTSTTALALNGGTIIGNGLNAILDLPAPGASNSLGDNAAIIIDTSDPADPVLTTPASDVLVNAANQTISGTHSEDGVTINLYADSDNDGVADNTSVLASTIVSGNGWSLSASLTADLANNFVVQAVDAAGNTSAEVNVSTITEDSTSPVITSDGGGASASLNVSENSTAVTTVTATDVNPVTYTISGGADQALFSISSGVLTFTTAPDFENPTDADTDNAYVVEVTASDGLTTDDTQTITVTVTDVDDNSPVITSDGGGATASLNVNENTTAVTTVTATDADGVSTVTYSISGGADQALFSMASGVLSFTSAPDFENPGDADMNNTYVVEVTATDGTTTPDTQTITVTVVDQNDNNPVITASQTFSVDETAANSTSIGTVTATDQDAGTTFSSWVITAGNGAGIFAINTTTGELTIADNTNLSPRDVTASYTLTLTVEDGLNTSAGETITINILDTTAPAAPVVVSISDDTGSDGSDQVTNDNTLSFTGTAEANSTVEVFIDGTSIGTTTADGSGNFTFDHTGTTLSDGTLAITAKATDASGNESTASAALTVMLDATPPAKPILGSITDDTGISNTDIITSDGTLIIKGTAEPLSVVNLISGPFTIGTVTTDASGDWEVDLTSRSFGSGFTALATATDAAGNVSAQSDPMVITIDQVDPQVSSIVRADASPTAASSVDFTVTFDEEVHGLSTANFSLVLTGTQNASIASISATSGTTVTVTVNNNSGVGTFGLNLSNTTGITDVAGNSLSGTFTGELYTTLDPPAAPVVVSISDDSGSDSSDEITNDNTLSFIGTSDANTTVEVFIDGTSIGTTTADGSGNFTFDHTGTTLSDGTIAVTARASDAIGNQSAVSAALSVTIDTAVPTKAVFSSISDDNGISNSDNITNDMTLIISGTSEPLSVVAVKSGPFTLTTTTADGNGDWIADITNRPFTSGFTVIATSTDVAGNVSADSDPFVIVIDVADPTVSSINRDDPSPTTASSVDYTVTFDEEVHGLSTGNFGLVFTGTQNASIAGISATSGTSVTVTVNNITGEGTFGLNLTSTTGITDVAGNTLAGTFTGQLYTTNSTPTDISLSSTSILENNSIGDAVGTLSSTDVDAGDTHTYTLVSGTGDTDNASFSINGTQLEAAAVFDRETKASYDIRLQTDDGNGGTFQKAFTITIDNVAEADLRITGNNDIPATPLGITTNFDITVHNDGDGAMTITSILYPTAFGGPVSGINIPAASSQVVTMTFTPTVAQLYTGDITIVTNGGTGILSVSADGAIITGTDDGLLSAEAINIFPNPASDQVTVDLSEFNGRPLDIQLFDLSGNKAFGVSDFREPKLSLDISTYQQGVYLMHFTDGKSTVQKKFMIRK